MSEHAELDWQVVSLTDVSESVRYGYTASASTDEIGPKFLRITDIVPQCISWDSVPYCEVNERALERYRLQVGDIVVARTGATVGYAKQIRTPENAVFASYLVRFRINSEIAEPRFIGHLVESNVYKHYVKSQVGGAAQPNANAKVLGRFSFTLPPRRDQHRTADILSAYDDLIENNRRRIALLEQAARELYREWFVRLRFPGHESARVVDGLPKGWETKTLGEVADIRGGKQFGGEELDDSHQYPVFGGNGIQGYSSKSTHTGFVIVFGRVGVNCGSIHWSYDGGWVNNNASSIVPRYFNELVLQHLLYYDFSHLRKGAAQPFIPNGLLSTVRLVIPRKELSVQYCNLVLGIRIQQTNLHQQTRDLARARDLLLPRLMSGEVPG